MRKLIKKLRIDQSAPNKVVINLQRYMNPSRSGSLPDSHFELFSIVLHHGDSLHSGHYTSLCKNIADNQWRHYDDSKVSEPIFSMSIFLDKINATPYLLFFKKETQSSMIFYS